MPKYDGHENAHGAFCNRSVNVSCNYLYLFFLQKNQNQGSLLVMLKGGKIFGDFFVFPKFLDTVYLKLMHVFSN